MKKKIRIYATVAKTYDWDSERETLAELKQKFQDESVGSVLTDLYTRGVK